MVDLEDDEDDTLDLIMRRRTKSDFFALFYLSKRHNVAVHYLQEKAHVSENRSKEIKKFKSEINLSRIS